MDRRYFTALSGLSLASFWSGGAVKANAETVPADKKSPLCGGRCYPAVTQNGPGGYKVIHDRLTYIDQYKYDNWKAGQNWDDDAGLWKDFSWQWGKGSLPMQHRPLEVLEGLFLLGPADYQQNIYLWDTGAGLLIIDPSYNLFLPLVETQIRQLGFELTEVKWVLLTHGHIDHGQSADAYLMRGAEIHICGSEAGVKETIASAPLQMAAKMKTFEDGEDLIFGKLNLKVIHTPGHTAGSSCFCARWQGKGVIVSGDHALHFGRHASMDPDHDWNAYLKSLWKLYEHPNTRDSQVLLPGHSTIDLEGARASVYRVLQVVSEIIRRKQAGEKLDWLNTYELFWKRRLTGAPEIEPLRI
jgi:glyoxylase-like metal-dependent hydrolase (beta-lactamase superfamily II)